MNNDTVSGILENLSGIESLYESIIRKYRDETGCRIVMSPIFFVPPEINSAFNIVTLKIPEFILNSPDRDNRLKSICDAVILPGRENLCGSSFISGGEYIFSTPSGFGEDAAVNLHNELLAMLKNLFNIDLKTIDIQNLQKKTAIYEKLRRTVRSIASIRWEKPQMLSNTSLSLIFETALILPPEIALDYILPLADRMRSADSSAEDKKLKVMIYGGRKIPYKIADEIEARGILIAEDDSCTGRRLFDISLNPESEYIFYELLDAYSYRPMTPCTRGVHERYELLYRLLRNYGIEAVIFFRDGECRDSMRDIDFLRIRLMRDGIDPVIIERHNYREVIDDYLKIAQI